MTSFECEFFGGPFHGQSLPIANDVNIVDMAEVHIAEFVTSEEPPEALFPTVRYTRIFNRRTPTLQFEYIGKAQL